MPLCHVGAFRALGKGGQSCMRKAHDQGVRPLLQVLVFTYTKQKKQKIVTFQVTMRASFVI